MTPRFRAWAIGSFILTNLILAAFPISTQLKGSANKDYPLWYDVGQWVIHGEELYLRNADDPAGVVRRDAAAGNGPIDALFKAISRVSGVTAKVTDYRVRAVTQDIDAQGEATVEIEHQGRRSSARAVSLDVIEASALAYLEVINRVVQQQLRDRLKPTDDVPTSQVPAG